MVNLFIVVTFALTMIGGMAIAREVSLFGKKKGFPIDWDKRKWDSFETICAYLATLVLFGALLTGVYGAVIGVFN